MGDDTTLPSRGLRLRPTGKSSESPNDRLSSEAVPGLSTFFENAAIHGEMRLVDRTGLALRLFQHRRRWNRRMINEDAKISHTSEPKEKRPDGLASRILPPLTPPMRCRPPSFVSHQSPRARSTLLIPPGDLLVVGIGHANLFWPPPEMPGYTGVLLEMPKTWMQAALG